jgi:hypothetical protein
VGGEWVWVASEWSSMTDSGGRGGEGERGEGETETEAEAGVNEG